MMEVQDVQRNLVRIRMRCRAFWGVMIGGLLLVIILLPLNYAIAKIVSFLWIILSIASWMSPMMNHCPSCYKPFYQGWVPIGLTVVTCDNCRVSLGETQGEVQA